MASQNPTPENQRNYRNLRNSANRIISKERFQRKKSQFQQEGTSNNKKWKKIKSETGQQQQTSPEMIKEGEKCHLKPRDMANALNRMYIQSIRKTISEIPTTDTNPMDHYVQSLGPVDSRLNLSQLNMSDFLKIFNKMSPTTSTTADFISIRVLKEAGPVLSQHLLHLVNSILQTEKYPQKLKTTKIVPIPKTSKDPTSEAGWRPINIVPALSKIVEKCILDQVVTYLRRNNFINHSHHGSVQSKSTQTVVQEILIY